MNRRSNDFTGSESNDTEFDLDDFFESVTDSKIHRTIKRHRDSSHSNMRGRHKPSCQQLANIIGGEVVTADPVCVIMRLRNIRATILGRRTRSPLALPFMLSFEDNGLNLGESVVLQREVNPMIHALQRRGIIVTAFHNHWLFEEPRLMYLHWEDVRMSPAEFARASRAAAREARLF
ncbi:DUF1259 domain-containing protein [Ornithinibacillus bavariensis]|uniref:DUF1259 domain-containing protein n=1 Tax=Ornithinibacillus bavariensis TaxID=545502 RepID=A0A920C549_9BACI|nr:DUF1259 domain-containing protein [Ornithinibacillus bavariensis]GIO26335.1 hypothetical protein J43TS3_09460 [Ornithinibacillus bavariensis]